MAKLETASTNSCATFCGIPGKPRALNMHAQTSQVAAMQMNVKVVSVCTRWLQRNTQQDIRTHEASSHLGMINTSQLRSLTVRVCTNMTHDVIQGTFLSTVQT